MTRSRRFRRTLNAHRVPAPAARAALLTAIVLVAGGVCAPRALADADPASDVLLAQNAFFPYQPPASPKLEAAMNDVLQAAARRWLSLKVAIIGAPEDLGAVPDFFGHPQPYAEFLDREISFNHAQPLLVVMAAGFGLEAAGSGSALARVPIDAQQRTYGLTRTAILAVAALARAAGHPIGTPSIPSASGSGSGVPVALLFVIPVALLALTGVLRHRRLARTRARRAPPSE